jgi:Ni/Co efflux regulator RcnB
VKRLLVLAGLAAFAATSLPALAAPMGDNHDHDRRHEAPRHGYRKGDRLPAQFRDSRHYVDAHDYGRYHLRQPPRGYRWTRDDSGNFILVAAATGIIADFLINH